MVCRSLEQLIPLVDYKLLLSTGIELLEQGTNTIIRTTDKYYLEFEIDSKNTAIHVMDRESKEWLANFTTNAKSTLGIGIFELHEYYEGENK